MQTNQKDHKDLAIKLVKAEQKLKASDFNAAYDIYQDLIKDHGNSPELYNNLAICAHQLQKNQECYTYINKALELDQENPCYLAQKAKFVSVENFIAACDLFEQAIKISLNRSQKETDQQELNQIKSDYAELLYNGGCHYAKQTEQQQLETAINLFKKSLLYKQNNHKALYNIACCYMNLDNIESGINYLKQTVKLNEDHSKAHFALSQYYQQMHNNKLTEYHLKKALDSDNMNLAQAEFNYGVLEQERYDYSKALEHYEKCISLCPEHFAAHYNTASINQTLCNYQEALQYYKKALALKPGDVTCQYLITSLQQTKLSDEANKNTQKLLTCANDSYPVPEKAPNKYIENLFNSYAEVFEYELVDVLDYHTPETLHELFTDSINTKNLNDLTLLDLGCGTGLIGELFTAYCSYLTGVDLSQGMLDVASKKDIYNKLIKSDIADFLESNIENQQQKYNLITFADVLVYIGKLDQIFELCKQNLQTESEANYLLFSIELMPQIEEVKQDYLLNNTGRYSHSDQYIQKICQKLNYKVIKQKLVTLRKQHNQDVTGMIYLIESP